MIDRSALADLMSDEEQRFVDLHPRSAELAESGRRHLLAGVPMPWMTRWPGAFPIHVASADGAGFVDVDGIDYVDFCLGDTGAMTGHGVVGRAAAASVSTTMLPSEDAAWVADELNRRFGMAKWQLTTSATDANRFVLRFARHLTGRPKIAVMDWCYHGTVDETLAILGPDGAVISRPGAIGPQVDPAMTTRVVPFNDLDALDAALAHGDVAALLMEPALTNIGIVLPQPGYHEAVREITRRHGVLLIIDETHTISAGPGGCTRAWGLDPDIVVIGKPIGGGFPGGDLRRHRRDRRGARSRAARPRCRRRRSRRHARRQRDGDRRDPSNALDDVARRRLRADDPAGRPVDRRGGRSDRAVRGSRGRCNSWAAGPSTGSARFR